MFYNLKINFSHVDSLHYSLNFHFLLYVLSKIQSLLCMIIHILNTTLFHKLTNLLSNNSTT
jgi:hypothetical protein